MVGPRGKQAVKLSAIRGFARGSKSRLSMWSSSEADSGSISATRQPTPLPADKHPRTEASPGRRMSGVRAYQLKQKQER